MSAAGPAKADATGSLAATPLSDMLVSLLDRRLTGSLVIQDPSRGKSALTAIDGAIVKARTPEPVVRLGDLLVELHALDPATLDRGLRLAKQGGIPLGQSLLRIEAVASPILDAALAEQLARRVVWISALPLETRYGFYSGTDFLANWGAGAIENDPLALIWRTARDHASATRVESVVARLAPRRVQLHAEARIDRFHFSWEEAAAIERLRDRPLVLGDLLATSGEDPQVLARMVYVLALTRHLDLGDGRSPIGVSPGQPSERLARAKSGVALASSALGVPSIAPIVPAAAGRQGLQPPSGLDPREFGASIPPSVPVPPPPLSRTLPPSGVQVPPPIPVRVAPEVEAGLAHRAPPSSASAPPAPPSTATPSRVPAGTSMRPGGARPDPLEWRLNAKLAQCERRDLYGLLEMEKTAPTAIVQAAYVKLAKVWHPDKLPATMAHRRDDATRLFAKLGEARRVLSDPEERARYDHEQATGESEESTVERVVEAASEFRKAELYARRNDFTAAIPHAESAFKNDDEQPEYAALFAFVVAQSGAHLEPKRVEELVKISEHAVARDADNVRIRLYRAFVFKRAGRTEDAMKDFYFVARHDRRNVDAMREIRLYNLRKDKEKSSGFLGNLFGRPSTAPKSRR